MPVSFVCVAADLKAPHKALADDSVVAAVARVCCAAAPLQSPALLARLAAAEEALALLQQQQRTTALTGAATTTTATTAAFGANGATESAAEAEDRWLARVLLAMVRIQREDATTTAACAPPDTSMEGPLRLFW